MNDSWFEFYNTESDLYSLYELIGPDKIMQDLELWEKHIYDIYFNMFWSSSQ